MFNDVEVNRKDFYASKKAIPLNLINTNIIVISYRVKQNNDTYKYFTGYLHDDDVSKPLCIIYHKQVNISNVLKIVVEKICHLKLKMKVFI